ncbi:alpha/beta hydrolase family protein [Hyphococcus sp.]|uniref:alpha/beta hydrolase family protein n=1 Tax=Hyphococcus sp. TaxID=2038636 RepID=UPI003CCBEE5F
MKKIVCLFFAAAAGCSSAPANTAAAPQFSELYGSYQFADGECVAGGRMDEGGESFLVLLDVWDGEPGGLFKPANDKFVSLIPNGPNISFEAQSDTLQLHWRGDNIQRVGNRISAPVARRAEFSSGEVRLSGALFLPSGVANKLPAVILAHGSGETSRYLGVWISYFTDLGFAVLSYDKRGVGESQGDWRQASFDDLSADVVSAADWLASQPEIDPDKIGLKTSSQSGWYGPRAVAQSGHFSFLMQRAGPGTPITATTLHEITEEWRSQGLAENVITAAGAFWTRLHAVIGAGEPIAAGQAILDEARRSEWFEPAYGDWTEIKEDWWARKKINLSYEPAKTAAALNIPVLWFLAENDQNVPYEKSKSAIETAAAAAGKTNLTLVTVSGSDHSFLIREDDGAIRYTTEYWSPMAIWLRDHGFIGEPVTSILACNDFPLR